MDIEYRVVELLIEKGMHITFAESCTAGKACAKLVNVPDASKVLNVSFTTYADEAKVRYLGVNPDTIKAVGVVSEEVAAEMDGKAYEGSVSSHLDALRRLLEDNR